MVNHQAVLSSLTDAAIFLVAAVREDGVPAVRHDRILDFSTARTGSLFFAPTGDFLDDLPPAPGS